VSRLDWRVEPRAAGTEKCTKMYMYNNGFLHLQYGKRQPYQLSSSHGAMTQSITAQLMPPHTNPRMPLMIIKASTYADLLVTHTNGDRTRPGAQVKLCPIHLTTSRSQRRFDIGRLIDLLSCNAAGPVLACNSCNDPHCCCNSGGARAALLAPGVVNRQGKAASRAAIGASQVGAAAC